MIILTCPPSQREMSGTRPTSLARAKLKRDDQTEYAMRPTSSSSWPTTNDKSTRKATHITPSVSPTTQTFGNMGGAERASGQEKGFTANAQTTKNDSTNIVDGRGGAKSGRGMDNRIGSRRWESNELERSAQTRKRDLAYLMPGEGQPATYRCHLFPRYFLCFQCRSKINAHL